MLTIEQSSVDLEFRYHTEENKLDMGIFAPTGMMTIEDAERMIEEFMRFFQ
jgi:ferricrocin synthase